MLHTVQIFFLWHPSNMVQKNGAEVGHYQGKTGFLTSIFAKPFANLWSSNLNRCMILQFVIVCISFDSF